MQWPLRIFVDKPNVRQVDKAAHRFAGAVFADALCTRAMVHLYFGDFKTLPAQKRQNVSMHFATDVQTFCGSVGVYAQRAASVVYAVGNDHLAQRAANVGEYLYIARV